MEVRAGAGVSLEEAAREARYAAWKQRAARRVRSLLTAQHADDQVETLLLALMRGAGPAGLAAMPRRAALGHGPAAASAAGSAAQRAAGLCRRGTALTWVDDPSNSSCASTATTCGPKSCRACASAGPRWRRRCRRSARHCATAAATLADVAAVDLAAAADGAGLDWPCSGAGRAARQRAGAARLVVAGRVCAAPRPATWSRSCGMLEARVDAHPLLALPEGARARARGAPAAGAAPVAAIAPCTSHGRGAGSVRRSRCPRGSSRCGRIAHGDLDLARLPAVLRVHCPPRRRGAAARCASCCRSWPCRLWERERLPLLYPGDGRGCAGGRRSVAASGQSQARARTAAPGHGSSGGRSADLLTCPPVAAGAACGPASLSNSAVNPP